MMRIAMLSKRSGVPVPTIKYYLRENLLPPGELTRVNQARYGDEHLRRLRLVRALVEVGRLPIASIRDLLARVDQPEPDLHNTLGHALTVAGQRESASDERVAAAEREVDELVARRGWRVRSNAPARRAVAEVVAALRHLGVEEPITYIDGYAEAAELIAQVDMGLVRHRIHDPAELVYGVIIGTIVGDSLLAGLRRLAQEDASAECSSGSENQYGH